MATLTEEAWEILQRRCDDCAVCGRDAGLDTRGRVPARPWWPERQARFLLISEAPPLTGGFWRTGEYDDLREHLFCFLPGLEHRFPNDLHGDEALQSFMANDLFLLQAVKWPFAKGSRKRRPSFNHLGPRTQDELIAHTTTAHLGPELALLAPKAVLAMGNAAWWACVKFIPGRADLRNVGVSAARGQRYEMTVEERPIPLEVTSLPVGQNTRRIVDAAVIQQEIAEFLKRHRGSQLAPDEPTRAPLK